MDSLREDLDDKDEFIPKGGQPATCAQRRADAELGEGRTGPPYQAVPPKVQKLYPYVIPNTLRYWATPLMQKPEVQIQCTVPGCDRIDWVFVSDLFQIKKCCEHRQEERVRRREERAQRLRELDRIARGPMESVSDVPVTEELGGIRPAHLLVKAKHDSSWVEYVDAEGNTKFMQVHDVRSARDKYGRWAVYGVDQNGDPVHELYDLRQGFEHSGTFSGIRELDFKEIVRLAQQGVIRGKDGKEVNTLSGLMQIADEPLRKLLIKKHKEAKVGGPSLAQIEKQLFADPTASSAQKRRAGKIRV